MTKPDKERADRLAAALRENLRKRKAQARGAVEQQDEAGNPLHHPADRPPPPAGED